MFGQKKERKKEGGRDDVGPQPPYTDGSGRVAKATGILFLFIESHNLARLMKKIRSPNDSVFSFFFS